jgi:hypothetical protein
MYCKRVISAAEKVRRRERSQGSGESDVSVYGNPGGFHIAEVLNAEFCGYREYTAVSIPGKEIQPV